MCKPCLLQLPKWLALLLLLPMMQAVSDTSNQTNIQIQEVKTQLLERLANAESQQAGRSAEDAMWQFWFSLSPTTEIRQLLDKGIERREAYDFEAAENYFDQVVKSAPDYSEGYNQRAFARFLRENYSASLTDLEKALELEPDHFGAMSGMYHILRIQNRHQSAMDLLRRAVTIHPWLQERGALPKDQWPESYRALHDPEQEI